MPLHAPYADTQLNHFYNLMFCDTPEIFGAWYVAPFTPIFDAPLNERAVRALAEDRNVESRMRALAFNRLRQEGKSVPGGKLFGVIVEAALERGLDTMAAYSDGRIRYINANEKQIVVEQDAPSLRPAREALLRAAEEVLGELKPSTEPRPAAPRKGDVRLSFVVSDGLYVGQAEIQALSQDYLGGPILRASNTLLNATIEFAKQKSS